MYGCVYYDKFKSKIHWSYYDEDGNRHQECEKWVPDFYVKTQEETKHKSRTGDFLKPIHHNTFKQRADDIKERKSYNEKVYGADLKPENKFILERWPNDIINPPKIRSCFLDIETESEGGFPLPLLAREKINLITCWSNIDRQFTTFGLEHDFEEFEILKNEHGIENINYVRCDDESELLERFIDYIDLWRFEIWSGWNSSGFDVPYIYNRILRVLDKVDVELQNKLLHLIANDRKNASGYYAQLNEVEGDMYNIKKISPFRVTSKKVKLKKDSFTKEMKPEMTYTIEGVVDYDYQVLDKQYGLHKRDSYKLGIVAQDELGRGKVELEESMKELYKNKWGKWVIYNIIDVDILVGLGDKLNYIPQSIALSYMCHCQFKDNFGTVLKAETAAYNFLMKEDIVMEDRGQKDDNYDEDVIVEETEDDKIPGGYVTPKNELVRGKHKWIIDVDIASLYPSIMRGINISPETKLAEVLYHKNIMDCDDDEEVALVNGNNGKTTLHKAGQVKKQIKDNNLHVSARNIIFKNGKTHRGFLVKMLDTWYALRKTYKKQQGQFRQEALDIYERSVEGGTYVIKENGIAKNVSLEDQKAYDNAMTQSGIFYNLQWSSKILLNSIYGCTASKFSRFYGQELASSTTLTGQEVTKQNGIMINAYFNNEFFELPIVKKNFPEMDLSQPDPNVHIYSDTDSLYLSFEKIMNKLGVSNTDADRLRVTRFLAKIAMNKLGQFNETFFEERFNAPNNIFWDQELVARSGIWCQPKKYVCHVLEENGKPPKDDMLKKGLDIVRSSIPRKFKGHITKVVDMALKDATEDEIYDYIRGVYKDFKTWSVDELAIPSACNNIHKHSHFDGGAFEKGCTQQMKAAVLYNHLLKKNGLVDYEPIKEKDRFSLIFVSQTPKFVWDTIGYMDKLPKEFGLEDTIAYEKHFERGMVKPLTQIFDALGWEFPEIKYATEDISDLFG